MSDAERRLDQAIAMIDAYTANSLRTTHLAALARQEGWEPKLSEYVREAAWVQSQLLVGVKPVGFASILFPADQRGRPAGEAFAAYRESIDGASAAASG